MNTRLVLTLVWLLVWSPRLEASNPVTSSGGQNRVGCEEVAVQTILLEARGEAHQGQTSIGEVLRTRARQRGTTPCQEALRPYQFSAWNNPAVAHKVLRRATANEWAAARAAWAESAHSEYSRGANHYHNPSVKPSWADPKRKVITIGRHIFYRL